MSVSHLLDASEGLDADKRLAYPQRVDYITFQIDSAKSGFCGIT